VPFHSFEAAAGSFRTLCLVVIICAAVGYTQEQKSMEPPVPGPMLEQGTMTIDTPDFSLDLVRSSQTVSALKPKSADGFDFTPGDLLVARSKDGYFHLGDLTLRLRADGTSEWKNFSTAAARKPVTPLPASGTVLASANLTPTLPQDFPLEVSRSWLLEGGKLVLRFTIKNKGASAIEIGALGIPMIFNNVLNDRSLDQAHLKCSFYDPYIGEDAGYLQVTRLSGHGPALLVVPEGETPFEAYNPILDKADRWGATPIFTDPTPRGITFEGFYEWMVHSKAYAENEWKSARPWNPPTSVTITPGQSISFGVKFLLSDTIRNIEKTLAENRRPVAVGIPGYVLPADLDGFLFLQYPRKVKSITVDPPKALTISPDAGATGPWTRYSVRGASWGRSRLTVVYEDGVVQTIHYFVTKPAAQVVSDMGRFMTMRQWFVDPSDPFHRSPSVMTYDRETNQIVMQDSRAWIAGLGDEGGGGWLSAILKQLIQPDKQEIDKLQQFVDGVLWGGLQYKDGPLQYGVRKSLFYYQPDQMPPGYYRKDFDWTTWTSWNKQHAERVDRSYDYPHVAAAYWVLYRLARNNQGLVTNHSWDWYLSHAYETSIAMTKFAGEYAVFGQMEGTVFEQILLDLKREGMKSEAANLQEEMRSRTDRWRKEAYPYGSEMPWDSTGQEEVYAWTKYFGYSDKADVTLNAILGYDPSLPHWGYNGSARRYWDFIFAGKDRRLERQLHHYGSSMNAIPVLTEYRAHPDDLYLLRVGYGGTMGTLTDIDQEGFASAAFHSFPDMLKPDPITGDFGPNFFGHVWNTATYITHDSTFGWLTFGGNLKESNGKVVVTPLDSYRSRVYIATLGLWLTLDSGKLDAVEVDPKTRSVRIGLAAANQFTPVARVRIEQSALLGQVGEYSPTQAFLVERDAYVVPLTMEITWVELRPQH